MGTSQSSPAQYEKQVFSSNNKKQQKDFSTDSARGRKAWNNKKHQVVDDHSDHAPHGLEASLVSHDDIHHHDFDLSERVSVHAEHEIDIAGAFDFDTADAVHTDDASSLEDDDFSYESSADEEEDEEWNERLMILQDAQKLKEIAGFFLHPELPVPNAIQSRCFFDRSGAPSRRSLEEVEEEAAIQADIAALKKAAVDYHHPELTVITTDPTACGRNYFTRPSAPEYDDEEDAEERALILADMKALKQAARDYMHPELAVVTSDPTACGRNYFTRPSAPIIEDAEEREQIMADMNAMKQYAVHYMHPELSVVTSDPSACGRNYFARASAPEYEAEDAEEREQIFQDIKMMKSLASDYRHPEVPVVTRDPTACGRNYFSRASAPAIEDAEEREQILKDVNMIKSLAVDYMHPELPVKTTDAAACGRNYFSRPSAPEEESLMDAQVREQVMQDMQTLKKLATDYLHPEIKIQSDTTAFARNFFLRSSAPDQDDDQEEREQILADIKAMKQLAVDYLHPEIPVVTRDPTACGRNYFTRASAPIEEDAVEHEQILQDMKRMKQLAVDYLHPELPVTTDSTAFGRNYFGRASAPEYEDEELANERDGIMADMKALKQSAMHYMHPELPLATTDPTVFGRNYFNRASASTVEEPEEREQILQDMMAMKKQAMDYLHPELPVVTSDPAACGRNYFSRPSAPEYDDEDTEEREQILHDMKTMKQLAMDYRHPELPVITTDPTVCGRNYFSRPSAPEYEDDAEELEHIFQDLRALKETASHFMHPEVPVVVQDATVKGRNYFTRHSAPEHYASEDAEECIHIMNDMKAMKLHAVHYLHPELPVKTSDPTLFGRNYFTRPSAAATTTD